LARRLLSNGAEPTERNGAVTNASGFDRTIIDKVATMGANFDETILGATAALYAPLVAGFPTSGVEISKDVAYGSDARHKLDIYRPAGKGNRILVFVPGGGFVGGDKHTSDAFWSNIGRYFAAHGVLTLLANYRLAPAHPWPAGAQDVGAVVAWTRAHAHEHGGDPERIVLFGQSAGAAHSAGYVFDPAFHAAGGPGVAALMLMNGVYRFAAPLRPPAVFYYGEDESQYAARSPLTHVGKSKVPLFLSLAEYDPPFLAAPTFELADAVTWRDGQSPQFAWFAGHNHVSLVMSIGSSQDEVGAALRAFIDRF
jgi:triacylglycerol lipase